MKASRYNHFFTETDGTIIAYNAFSNSLATLSAEKYLLIQDILENRAKSDDPIKTAEYLQLSKDLVEAGYIVDDCVDEFEILKAQTHIGRFSSEMLQLTLAPVTRCMFSCVYCFENNRSKSMTPEIEDALIQFVKRKIEGKKLLSVSWFGGEPLLDVDIIERLTSAFKELCQEHHTKMLPSSIITNGYLLTREVAERLKASNISFTQITLDGIPEVHDKRRMLKNGCDTFHKILENIKNATDLLNICVRVNVDKTNSNRLEEFYKYWADEGLVTKIPFYLSPVFTQTDGGGCADISGQCIPTEDFAYSIIEESQKARKYGIYRVDYPKLNKLGYCTADRLHSFVIDASGSIFKCWEQVSSDESNAIGNVLNPDESENSTQIMNKVRFLNWDPFEDSQCKTCSILPICGGGCVYRNVKGLDKSRICSTLKYNLQSITRLKINYGDTEYKNTNPEPSKASDQS